MKKIESLSSIYEAKQIQRQVFVANRVKAMNELIYLNVDVIHKAVSEEKKIGFRYFDYDLKKKKSIGYAKAKRFIEKALEYSIILSVNKGNQVVYCLMVNQEPELPF